MNRIFNFNAGPSTLPLPALERAQRELLDYQGSGMSILEMSHRSAAYEAVHASAKARLRDLLALPTSHRILFLGGGATLQFAMIPMNLLREGEHCDIVVSGTWAKKAMDDVRHCGREARAIFEGGPDFTGLPGGDLARTEGSTYLHLTSNETIGGVQWPRYPDSPTPIVADMSSDILSRPFDAAPFGLIFAGAQKNMGPAGATVVIIREDLLERCPDDLPVYLNYKTHAARDSMYNTPPVFAIYMLDLALAWLQEQGGVAAAESRAEARFASLMGAIEASQGFYRCPIDPDARSRMNAVFRLPTPELEARFVSEATAAGLVGLKGHRSVGGCRASLYNAMPQEGVEALIAFMTRFASGA